MFTTNIMSYSVPVGGRPAGVPAENTRLILMDMNLTSGSTVLEQISNSTKTFSDSPTWGNPGSLGQYALRWGGSTHNLNGSASSYTNFSVHAWIYMVGNSWNTGTTGGAYDIFEAGSSGDNFEACGAYRDGYSVDGCVIDFYPTRPRFNMTSFYDAPTHCVWVRDTSNFYYYVDGTIRINGDSITTSSSKTSWYVGAYSSGYGNSSLYLYNVCVYNYALNSTEVTALYNAGRTFAG